MYLHIGKNCVIKDNSVIGIFDVEKIANTIEFTEMEQFLNENNNLIDISYGHKNSFILTEKNNQLKGYISNIVANTIKKRKI